MPAIKIAVYQGGCPRGVEDNLELLEKVMEEASEKGVDLVVFSETFLHGYCAGPILRDRAEIQNGPSFQCISQIAARLKIATVYGYSEREKEGSDVLYNSCAFVGKDGTLTANYRKTHLWGAYEKSFFTPGNEFLEPFDFMGIKVSMLICFDIEFPEPARILATKGVQLLIVPTALVGYDMTTITVPSRALENHIFIAYANRCGTDTYPDGKISNFCGNSLIAAPSGHAVARASRENSELIFSVVDTDAPEWQREVEMNPYLTSRRTDLY